LLETAAHLTSCIGVVVVTFSTPSPRPHVDINNSPHCATQVADTPAKQKLSRPALALRRRPRAQDETSVRNEPASGQCNAVVSLLLPRGDKFSAILPPLYSPHPTTICCSNPLCIFADPRDPIAYDKKQARSWHPPRPRASSPVALAAETTSTKGVFRRRRRRRRLRRRARGG
jgi:hypothetical protein